MGFGVKACPLLKMNSTDVQLIRAIAEGDADAFAEFYDRYSSRAYGLVLRLVRDRVDAEDILQDAFWQVWECANRFDRDRSSPIAWLFMIVRSRAIDHMRRKKVRENLPIDNDVSIINSPSSALEGDESAAVIRTALDQLPIEQSHAIRLAFYEGFSHVQVAASQDVPLGTIKTRIRLGVNRLRDVLSAQRELSPT